MAAAGDRSVRPLSGVRLRHPGGAQCTHRGIAAGAGCARVAEPPELGGLQPGRAGSRRAWHRSSAIRLVPHVMRTTGRRSAPCRNRRWRGALGSARSHGLPAGGGDRGRGSALPRTRRHRRIRSGAVAGRSRRGRSEAWGEHADAAARAHAFHRRRTHGCTQAARTALCSRNGAHARQDPHPRALPQYGRLGAGTVRGPVGGTLVLQEAARSVDTAGGRLAGRHPARAPHCARATVSRGPTRGRARAPGAAADAGVAQGRARALGGETAGACATREEGRNDAQRDRGRAFVECSDPPVSAARRGPGCAGCQTRRRSARSGPRSRSCNAGSGRRQ